MQLLAIVVSDNNLFENENIESKYIINGNNDDKNMKKHTLKSKSDFFGKW